MDYDISLQRRESELRQHLLNFYIRQYDIIQQRIDTNYTLLIQISNHINSLYINDNNITINNRDLINVTTQERINYIPTFFLQAIHRNDDNREIIDDSLDPQTIRPSEEQIRTATTDKLFSEIENPLNSSCPIRCEEFQPSDNILQINICKHIFYPLELKTWFNINTRCPICRLDFRTNFENQSQSQNTEIELIQQLLNLLN
jgi:hypothetical protein